MFDLLASIPLVYWLPIAMLVIGVYLDVLLRLSIWRAKRLYKDER
jgi:hypothetical protein